MAPTLITNTTPPIEYPKVKIGAATLTVKFNFQAKYLLSQWGISLVELGAIVKQVVDAQVLKAQGVPESDIPAADPRLVAKMTQTFAACVGHNYTALGQEPPDPMYWAGQIDDETWPGICRAVWESMGKVLPSTKTAAPVEVAKTAEPIAVQ